MRTFIPRMTGSTPLLRAVLLIAMTLRAPITAVGPLTDVIRTTFHLGAPEAGVLTTLPLLAFAVVSPLAGSLSRFGLEKSLFGAMILISVGTLIRSAGSSWCLYVGTCIIGCGIAVGNVLLPSLMRRDFSDRIARLTATYAVTMSLAAALTSVIAVPLARLPGFGWGLALGTTAVFPVCAAFGIWQLGSWKTQPKATPNSSKSRRIWRSAIAWQVTLFLGLNSFVYYVAVGWFPSILAELGYSPEQAGSFHGLMQISAAIPALVLIPAVGRIRDHRLLAVLASTLSAAGLIGLVFKPAGAALWVALFGGGTGATMILALSFLSLRATTSHGAAVLSGMAQCVGYALAAAGPPLIGALREAQGDWTVPLLLCSGLCLLVSVLGMFAGRAARIEDGRRRA